MSIIDQSDVILANRVVLAVIDDHRAIPNIDVDRARAANNQKLAKTLQNIQAFELLSEMTADQRRHLAIAYIKIIAKKDGCTVEMDRRLNKLRDNYLYDIIDNNFAAKLKELQSLRDEFEQNA